MNLHPNAVEDYAVLCTRMSPDAKAYAELWGNGIDARLLEGKALPQAMEEALLDAQSLMPTISDMDFIVGSTAMLGCHALREEMTGLPSKET